MKIAAIREQDVEGYHAVLDAVARERIYLGRTEAPPLEDSRKFVQEGLRKGRPQFLAWIDDRVVGWCDIIEKLPDLMRHSGVLGIGLLAAYRRRGIGAALMEATLDDARKKGFKRVELTVRTDNERAKRVYEQFGFEAEGICRRFICDKGEYRDGYLMSVLYD